MHLRAVKDFSLQFGRLQVCLEAPFETRPHHFASLMILLWANWRTFVLFLLSIFSSQEFARLQKEGHVMVAP